MNKKLQETTIVKQDHFDESAEVPKNVYNPSDNTQTLTGKVYKALQEMINELNQRYNEFGKRTLKIYLDDNNKRLNSYAVSNDLCNPPKEEWQSNNPTTIIRDTFKKVLASFALTPPEMETKAFGENDIIDFDRAEVAKWLITGSYLQEENPIIENFWESWECGTQGTVIKYEGYLKTRYKQKFIKEYDPITGVIEFDEKEVDIDDKCISFLLGLEELYIRDFYVHNIQDQTDLCWVRYYDEDLFFYEFQNYANAKYVKTSTQLTDADPDNFYFQSKWKTRTNEKMTIEVVRYYNRLTDTYCILANGVMLIEAPLLWQVNGRKVYPFAKSIWEPFVNKKFFYGKSYPDTMSGKVDDYETTRNNMLDSQWKSTKPGLLVGRVNQDALDLEDEYVTDSTRISVEDVTQVKLVPSRGIDSGDVQMITLISREITESSPSLPNMLEKRNATAREIVLSEEHIQELRLIHREMIVELWRQKYILRLSNIQLHYPKPRTIMGEGGKVEKTVYRTFVIDNAVIDKKTNQIGILAIQFRDFPLAEKKKIQEEISVEEEMMKQEGVTNYRKRIIPQNYLDNYRINIEIIPSSLMKRSQGAKRAEITEKISYLQKLFPQVLVVNQIEYFEQFSNSYDDPPGNFVENLKAFHKQQEEKVKQDKTMAGEERIAADSNEQLKAISEGAALVDPEEEPEE